MRQVFPQDSYERKLRVLRAFAELWHRNCLIIGHVPILALDTSSPYGSIAVLHDSEIASCTSTIGELRSSHFFCRIESLLREADVDMADIDVFAIATGPGSFTGLRIGLAAVKGWAEVYGKPIAAVSVLEAVAAQSHSDRIVSVLDARRGQVYFGVYQRAGTKANEDRYNLVRQTDEAVGTPEEFLVALHSVESRNATFSVATPVPELLRELLSRSETIQQTAVQLSSFVEQVSPILAPHIGRIGLRDARNGRLTNALSLDANYVRRSDAELHWKVPAGS